MRQAEHAMAIERIPHAAPGGSFVVPYKMAELRIESAVPPLHEIPMGTLAAWVEQVVTVESPVHFDEVASRIAAATGVRRVGHRIRAQLELACQSAKVQTRGEFLWIGDVTAPAVRDRSALPADSRRFEYIAPEEIGAALEQLVAAAHGIEPGLAIQEVCYLFGFSRATQGMRESVLLIIEELCNQSRLGIVNSQLVKVEDGASSEEASNNHDAS